MDSRDIIGLAVFLADALVVGIAAWRLVCASGHAVRGFLEAALAWFWFWVALILGAGVVLGEFGGLGAVGFLRLHAAIFVVVWITRRTKRDDDVRAFRRVFDQARSFFNRTGGERLVALGLLTVLAILLGIAAWAEAAVPDALQYHLPRMAHWLQDGRIRFLDTEEVRLTMVATLPDIFGAWLLGATREGFRFVILGQALGGIMTVGATIGLARHTELTHSAALLAGALLLGMANVVAQFTAAQTDLFTTGVFVTAFYLWMSALRARQISVPGLLGAGLALGAKGTLFYLAPGALIWVAWLAWRHRLSGPQWRRSVLIAIAGVIFFAGPGFWRNWRGYGHPLGPQSQVDKHHREITSASELGRKLRLNSTAALAQNLAPTSQPWPFRVGAQSVAEALAAGLPAEDDYTLDRLNRRGVLQQLLGQIHPDADTTAFGGLVLILFVVGAGAAVASRRPEKRLVLVWAAGVAAFFVFFHALHQWHPFSFRYQVLAAPWIAVVGAWGLEQLPTLLRRSAWVLAITVTANVASFVTLHTPQSGWRAVVSPERAADYLITQRWREWTRSLDTAEEPLALALPAGLPLAAFYREAVSREVTFVRDATSAATAEAVARDRRGWVIVPASQFMTREGDVIGRTWLMDGDEKSQGSLAAFRKLRVGEKPAPVLYRNLRVRGVGETRFQLLIKTWDSDPVRLTLANPGRSERDYVVITPLDRIEGRLASAATMHVDTRLPAGAIAEVRVEFLSRQATSDSELLPAVHLGAR